MNVRSILFLLFFSSAAFAQVESASEATTTAPPMGCHHGLKILTPAERDEFRVARQKASRDPAVQSTREINRMAIHKAMLRADPSIETIFANMNANGAQSDTSESYHAKSLGKKFNHWLAYFPPTAVAALTPEERTKLENAYQKALFDPSVRQTQKDAQVVFYNALMRADPLLGPILAKLHVPTPSNIRSLSPKSTIGSEEQILGGDFQTWGEEVLAPAIQNQSPVAPASDASPAKSE